MLSKEYCPQCGRESDSSRVRLVQDSCGHKKCRECLLSEETGCLSCSNSTNPVFTDLRPVPQSQHPDIIADQITDAVITSMYTEENSHSDSIPQASLDVMTVSEQQDSPTVEPLVYQNTLDDGSTDSQDEEIPENNATVKKRPTYGLKEHIVFTPGKNKNVYFLFYSSVQCVFATLEFHFYHSDNSLEIYATVYAFS